MFTLKFWHNFKANHYSCFLNLFWFQGPVTVWGQGWGDDGGEGSGVDFTTASALPSPLSSLQLPETKKIKCLEQNFRFMYSMVTSVINVSFVYLKVAKQILEILITRKNYNCDEC